MLSPVHTGEQEVNICNASVNLDSPLPSMVSEISLKVGFMVWIAILAYSETILDEFLVQKLQFNMWQLTGVALQLILSFFFFFHRWPVHLERQ